MKVTFYDIEIFVNYYLVTFKTGDKREIFEFSERSQLNVKKYLKFINNLNGEYVCGFNSINYDNLVLAKSIELLNNNLDIDYLFFCRELKDFSDLIIYGQNVKTINWAKKQPKETQLKLAFDIDELKEEIKLSKFNLTEFEWYDAIKPYKYVFKFKNFDLLLFWSQGLRMTKQLSLKSIACQLGYPVIQELPLHHTSIVTLEDMDAILNYNSIHDIGVTEMLFNHMKEEVDLRLDVSKEYNIDCLSFDAPKIASEILLQSYCKEKYNDTGWEILKEVRNNRTEHQDFIFGDYLPDMNFKTPLFQKMFEKCKQSQNTFYYELIIPFPETIKIIVSYGGIHSSIENKVYKSTLQNIIVSKDVSALYPTLIENLKVFKQPEVLNQYCKFKSKRLTEVKPTLAKYKQLKDKENITIWKIKDTFLKLILNGVSGLIDSKYNWLYNNVAIGVMRVYGQLMICRFVEECFLKNIQVISVNTDSCDTLIDKDRIVELNKIANAIEKEFNITFEDEFFKAIYFKNVNNYLAITEDGKKVKGSAFIEKPAIGNSNDFLCIPKALNKYLVEGIKPESILNEKEWSKHFHIYDFCASYKIAKKYTVLYNGKPQQQLNRFFVSKKGYYLYKQKKGKNIENVLKGWAVELLNRYDENRTDYKIDFKYYLSKINETINDLEPTQINLF